MKQLDIQHSRAVVRLHVWLAKVLINQDRLLDGLYLGKVTQRNQRNLNLKEVQQGRTQHVQAQTTLGLSCMTLLRTKF